jgi:hypothetical protein
LGNHPTNGNINIDTLNVVKDKDELIQVSVSGSVYTFDLMNVNENSLRQIYYEGELPTSDENSKLATPYYKGFTTGGIQTYYRDSGDDDAYISLRNLLDNGGSPNPNILNDGYRVPNLREAALMSLYCNQQGWWDGGRCVSTTYFSYGTLGQNKHHTTRWLFGGNSVSLDAGEYSSLRIRFVKDIK